VVTPDEFAKCKQQNCAGWKIEIPAMTYVLIEPAYYLVWVDDKRFPSGEFFDHFHDDHEPDVRARLAREENQNGYRI